MTSALAMGMALARLAVRHGIAPGLVNVPLSEPTAGPMTLVGYAATTDLDLSRQKFRRYAFTNLCTIFRNQPLPPLYWKHNPSHGIVGQITELKDDADGNLRITADVDHPLARRANAFSVGCRVEKFSLHNENSPDYCALIEQAEILEISLTDSPANPQARVLHRFSALPLQPYLDAQAASTALLIRSIDILGQMTQLLGKTIRSPAAAPSARLELRPIPAAIPRRPTQFKQLVEAMNR